MPRCREVQAGARGPRVCGRPRHRRARPQPRPASPGHRLSDAAFDSLRLWVLVALCALRLAVTRPHLQAYLCLAKARVEQLRREAGRIEAREVQRRVGAGPGRPRGGRGPGWAGDPAAVPLSAARWCACTAT